MFGIRDVSSLDFEEYASGSFRAKEKAPAGGEYDPLADLERRREHPDDFTEDVNNVVQIYNRGGPANQKLAAKELVQLYNSIRAYSNAITKRKPQRKTQHNVSNRGKAQVRRQVSIQRAQLNGANGEYTGTDGVTIAQVHTFIEARRNCSKYIDFLRRLKTVCDENQDHRISFNCAGEVTELKVPSPCESALHQLTVTLLIVAVSGRFYRPLDENLFLRIQTVEASTATPRAPTTSSHSLFPGSRTIFNSEDVERMSREGGAQNERLNGMHGEYTNSDDVNARTLLEVVLLILMYHIGSVTILPILLHFPLLRFAAHSYLQKGVVLLLAVFLEGGNILMLPFYVTWYFTQTILLGILVKLVSLKIPGFQAYTLVVLCLLVRHFRSQLNGANGEFTGLDGTKPKTKKQNVCAAVEQVMQEKEKLEGHNDARTESVSTEQDAAPKITSFCDTLSSKSTYTHQFEENWKYWITPIEDEWSVIPNHDMPNYVAQVLDQDFGVRIPSQGASTYVESTIDAVKEVLQGDEQLEYHEEEALGNADLFIHNGGRQNILKKCTETGDRLARILWIYFGVTIPMYLVCFTHAIIAGLCVVMTKMRLGWFAKWLADATFLNTTKVVREGCYVWVAKSSKTAPANTEQEVRDRRCATHRDDDLKNEMALSEMDLYRIQVKYSIFFGLTIRALKIFDHCVFERMTVEQKCVYPSETTPFALHSAYIATTEMIKRSHDCNVTLESRIHVANSYIWAKVLIMSAAMRIQYVTSGFREPMSL